MNQTYDVSYLKYLTQVEESLKPFILFVFLN